MNCETEMKISDYLMNPPINLKKDKQKEFLRFKKSSDDFFELDNESEIVETKNSWAMFAYLLLIEKKENKNLFSDEKEEMFYNEYFSNYLLTTECVGIENELKGLYLKHRLSQDFQIELEQKLIDNGSDEFRITLEAFLREIYKKNIKVQCMEDVGYTPYHMYYLPKNETLVIDELYLLVKYNEHLNNEGDISSFMDLLQEVLTSIDSHEFNDIKRHEISKRAIVYAIEDYLDSKASKKTRLGRVYKQLYNDIIANKQKFIDCSKQAYDRLVELGKNLSKAQSSNIDSKINMYLDNMRVNLDNLKHYYPDSKYFDVNNLEDDAFAKLYQMYIRGLKAMPRSQIYNVTNNFSIKGNPLTIHEMEAIKLGYEYKVNKCKDESKKELLIKKANDLSNVIDTIKEHSISYQIEEKMDEIVKKGTTVDSDFSKYILENYEAYLDVCQRISTAKKNLYNIASSGSASKTKTVLDKEKYYEKMLTLCEKIDLIVDLYNDMPQSNGEGDIVISKTSNEYKTITMLQELTGKDILSSKELLNSSINKETPVMRELTPGFKEFAMNALMVNGVRKFK